jgi:hypothetical protein
VSSNGGSQSHSGRFGEDNAILFRNEADKTILIRNDMLSLYMNSRKEVEMARKIH